jgi:signal transduction histidine kinase
VTDQPETAAQLREVVALAQKTLEDARRAVWDMRSPSLAAGEFTAALRTAVEECTRGTGLSPAYEVEGQPRPVDPEVEAVVFRVVQEALANVVKHAAAQSVRVRCVFGARQLRVTIDDDGKGFTVDPDFRAYGGHWGLLGMRERAGQIGAKVAVRSSPGQGARVTLLVPYRARGTAGPRGT